MVPTYMLQGRVSDLQGNVYVSFPREMADQIMGMNANEFKKFKEEQDVEATKELFNNRQFRVSFTFLIPSIVLSIPC